MFSRKEEYRLTEENLKLKKENGDILMSINTSRLVLEDVKKKEVESNLNLEQLSREVEKSREDDVVAQREVEKTLVELKELRTTKDTLLCGIEKLKNEQVELSEKAQLQNEREIELISTNLEVKQIELNEVLNKIKIENKNLERLSKESIEKATSLEKMKVTYQSLTDSVTGKTMDITELDEKIVSLQLEIEKTNAELAEIRAVTDSYKKNQSELIEQTTALIKDREATEVEINTIKNEVVVLQKKRDEAEADYKASESKVFALVKREEAVSEREEYARERYKVAGLEY